MAMNTGRDPKMMQPSGKKKKKVIKGSRGKGKMKKVKAKAY